MPGTALRVRFLALLALTPPASALAQKPAYPPTRVDDVVATLHGVEVHDPYRWLENESDPAVREWTDKQNAFTRSFLDRFTRTRSELTQRLTEVYAPGFASSPAIHDKRYFFTKREGKQNHALVYVKKNSIDAEPAVALDPNTFSADGTVALDWWYPSPDGTRILYGKSSSGNEKSTLYLRDVDSGVDTALIIPNTRYCSVAWDKDGQGFHYTRYPEPGSVPAGDENYYRHLYYHKFGTRWEDDPKVFGEGRPKEESISIANSDDYRYQFLTTSVDWARQDLHLRAAGEEKFAPVAVGLDGQFGADVLGDRLFILTNYQAPRYHVLVTDVNNPSQGNWKELIPEQKGVIQSMAIVDGKLVLTILENACSRLVIHDVDGKLVKEIELPTLGTVSGVSGRFDKPELFYSFASYAYPNVTFRYDMRTGETREIDRVRIDFDPAAYETRQVWFASRDGTRVPMFVIHKKGLKLDGNNPTVLYGYGGFDISLTPAFDRKLIPWLDRGGVYAVANLRGGGEFGKDWHLAGRLGNKQNVFDDMIAAAEKLIADKYTSPARLGAAGGSNGGLLMGAMLTQRPELFRAIHCAVPLLDMLRYHNFSIARLWIPEYGSADDPEQFKWLYSYSPYHHVKQGAKYPSVLFTTAESDSRVDAHHAKKMAALVQASTGSDNPVLLWVETKAGHGQGKPLTKIIDSQVDVWTYFMWQLGMNPQ